MENATYYYYAEILHPKTFIVNGVELLPFSLGHWMILERMGSPFLSGNIPVDISFGDGIASFFELLLVCGQTYEDNIAMLDNPQIFKETIKSFENHMKKVMKKDKHWHIQKEVANIKEYLSYFIKMPSFTDKANSKTVPSGIDWKSNLLSILKNEYHYTESEALNCSVKKCFYLWCIAAEKQGSIQVSNKWEVEQLKQIGVKGID